MAVVKSIGGVSIYTGNSGALARWYERHLGIRTSKGSSEGAYYCDFFQEDPENPTHGSQTVWTILPTDEGSERPASGLVLSYIVEDLAEMLEQLRTQGVEVERVKEDAYGRYAWLRDPEGRLIELWED